ncbi:hypothetical protein [Agaribacter flavus]|uniref:Uncharacterized protein n=1 Tax=Agaribacter flavus TaxID=1902781 RepID=A0ABV7FT12_9ALTE
MDQRFRRAIIIAFLLFFSSALSLPIIASERLSEDQRSAMSGTNPVRIILRGFSAQDIKSIESFLVHHSAHQHHAVFVRSSAESELHVVFASDRDTLLFFMAKILANLRIHFHRAVNDEKVIYTLLQREKETAGKIPQGVW